MSCHVLSCPFNVSFPSCSIPFRSVTVTVPPCPCSLSSMQSFLHSSPRDAGTRREREPEPERERERERETRDGKRAENERGQVGRSTAATHAPALLLLCCYRLRTATNCGLRTWKLHPASQRERPALHCMHCITAMHQSQESLPCPSLLLIIRSGSGELRCPACLSDCLTV